MQDCERIGIFATNENISHLKHSKIKICNVTLKTMPSSLERLLIIQFKNRTKNNVLLYCFMKRKTKISYQWCLNFVKEFDDKIGPKI